MSDPNRGNDVADPLDQILTDALRAHADEQAASHQPDVAGLAARMAADEPRFDRLRIAAVAAALLLIGGGLIFALRRDASLSTDATGGPEGDTSNPVASTDADADSDASGEAVSADKSPEAGADTSLTSTEPAADESSTATSATTAAPAPSEQLSAAGATLILVPNGPAEGKVFGAGRSDAIEVGGSLDAVFAGTDRDLELIFRTWDVDQPGEVEVLLNGEPIGRAEDVAPDDYNDGDSFAIDVGDQGPGVNTIRFVSSDPTSWAVESVILVGPADTTSTGSFAVDPPPGGVVDVELTPDIDDERCHAVDLAGCEQIDHDLTVAFEATGTDLTLTFGTWSSERSDETQVFLNGRHVLFVKPGPADGYNGGDTLRIPAAVQLDGVNTLQFVHTDRTSWGVTSLSLRSD